MPTPRRTTNAQVVAAAQEVLESAGPAGLTMQAVATRVGVRAPSLYKRFHDREALVAAVSRASVEELGRCLEAAAPELEALAVAYRAFAHERPEAFRLIFAVSAPQEVLRRAAGPVVDACALVVGEDHALDAARLFTAWATGFLHMELAGAFRMGGDIDQAFDYGLRHLVAGLRA
ncbi:MULTISPECIES: TetR/AcrR family transcriptional regulator [unclassified Isoptericola]|uniref:TetR/AcrR family transcriptional regulator n=1 Tax=unclassified Isoptericola TaxID=2623355 RepID=UPI00271435E8|nr:MULTISPECIES: TetR/AcrR family transcriptional regulator [unclassified Isoptericola]MDO8144295.1 TetR/AcrR family transcriptional regulator [Isoptericola sp. 178]MDO8148149.1 TetR/AcrR family transcriptional regulator [Isoptericola sp. b515]